MIERLLQKGITINMIFTTNKVSDIRNAFKEITPDSETGMLEIVNASFIADEVSIFGTVNQDWNSRELHWYKSQSLYVTDIPAPIPTIWQSIAGTDGSINSNYGWCIWSADNGSQYQSAIAALQADKSSRQASMIYTRPSIHVDATAGGKHDMICTYSVQLLIRNNKLYYLVYMRSNDAVFGYKGDKAWHDHVYSAVYSDLRCTYPDLQRGDMIWNAASLHVYPRHAHLVSE
jgi:thymidylate synthase